MPEDRPTQEQIEDDMLFDKWTEYFERKMQQQTAKRIKMSRDFERKQAHASTPHSRGL